MDMQYNIGDKVRVLPPFKVQLPGTYEVFDVTNEGLTCRILLGGDEVTDIDVQFLEIAS